MTKLLIKYQNSYICERYRNEIDFISIPTYHPKGDSFSNISIFITLLFSNHITEDYSSNINLKEIEWSNLFEEYFIPEYLHQVDKDTFIYDIDELLKDYPDYQSHYNSIISNLKFPITIKTIQELKDQPKEINFDEQTTYNWLYPVTTTNKELQNFITKKHHERKDNDVLLLYSGGKDSTLAAIRLYNAGYNIHFIHFDNGHMRDQDKPYLTFQETFGKKDDFYFDYELSSVDIKPIFEEYYSNWSTNFTNDPSLTSEIRCLSCRMAMYTKAIEIAKKAGFKFIAEGARISQKFMLEQLPITNRLKELAESQGIKLLLPVLYVNDDQQEIEELLTNGYSSKTWESKCLIGKPAKDKTDEDKIAIIDYYDSVLKPNILKKIK